MPREREPEAAVAAEEEEDGVGGCFLEWRGDAGIEGEAEDGETAADESDGGSGGGGGGGDGGRSAPSSAGGGDGGSSSVELTVGKRRPEPWYM